MGNSIIFPSNDMSAYRIVAPPPVSDEDEGFLFHREGKEKEKKELTPKQKKVNDLIKKKFLFENFGILDPSITIDLSDVSMPELFAYAVLKKDMLKPAMQAIGIQSDKAKNPIKQDRTQLVIRMVLGNPKIYKKINPSLGKFVISKKSPDAEKIKRIPKKKFF